ncbi:MAG: class I SAM-dependent methyltransferase [Candidatus Heimdallarchaeota archaeon]|nr:class I SAM-dependent methyltransferase [Candidatus Heimdallarchaeota archaeon]
MATTNLEYANLVKHDFDKLSKAYDLLNNFMSMGTDKQFRYLAIKNLIPEKNSPLSVVLDFGTGTGHLANELHRQKPGVSVVGMDLSHSMIKYCREREIYKDGNMNLVLGDVAKTPFRRGASDSIMSGFVGRHFVNYPVTLREHYRVLRSKGRIMMLEMGRRATPFAPIIDVYVGQMMSLLGRLAVFIVTLGKAPFRLLEETYARFHSPKELKELYENAGFLTKYKIGFMGSIVIVMGLKK